MCNTYLYMRNEPENKRGVDSYMHITPTLLYAHPVYPWITRLSVACTQTTYIRTCERIKITCCPIKPTIRIMRRQHLLYTQSTHTHTELKCIIMTTQCCTHMYICCITSCERTLYILYTHSTNTVCMSLYNTIQHSIHVRPNVHMRPKYDTAHHTNLSGLNTSGSGHTLGS